MNSLCSFSTMVAAMLNVPSSNMANDFTFGTSHDIRLDITNFKVSMVPVLALHKLLLISKVREVKN